MFGLRPGEMETWALIGHSELKTANAELKTANSELKTPTIKKKLDDKQLKPKIMPIKKLATANLYENALSAFIITNSAADVIDVISNAEEAGINLLQLMITPTVYKYNGFPTTGYMNMAIYGNTDMFRQLDELNKDIFSLDVSKSIIFQIIQNKNKDAFNFLMEKHGIDVLNLGALKLNNMAKMAGLM